MLCAARVNSGVPYCNLNGERYRPEGFTFAALRNSQSFVDVNRFTALAEPWRGMGGPG
jgi:hypothetical protein